MTRIDCACIGLCLLAAVLLDVAASRIGFAEESGPAAHVGAGSNSSPEPSGSPPPPGENGPGGAEKSAPENKDSDRIDTRITVQPHGPAVGRDDARQLKAKVRSWAAGNLPRRLTAHEPVGRNAIGVAVAPHENPGRRNGHGSPFAVHGPVAAMGTGASASGGMVKAGAGPGGEKFARPLTAPGLAAAPVHRGTIAGTGMTRPGASPSPLGGSSKAVAGINGSTIRPKY
jgi:hypothetical protein